MNHYENIKNYIDGRLSSAEKTAFEKELNNNSNLQKALEEAQINGLLEDVLFVQQAKEELNALSLEDQSQKKETKVISLFSGRNLSIAASFLILITAGLFLFNQDTHTEIDYDNYYSLPVGNTVRGDNDKLLKEIELAFVQKNWPGASKSVSSLENANLSMFFKAHIAFNQNDFITALNEIEKISETDKTLYQKAEFLKVLSLLKLENTSDAKTTLMNIKSNKSHYFNSEASEILTKLFN